jgi:predicted amidohydrolase
VTDNEREIVVGIAQWLPRAGGLEDAIEFTGRLAEQGCELVVLPELWPCAHDPADPAGVAREVKRHAEPIDGPRTRALADTARDHGIWLAAGSVPESTEAGTFNTALLFSPEGALLASHRKARLYRPMHEDLAFEPGRSLTVCDTQAFGRVGLLVCFDGDFPETARALRRSGARVVIQVNAYEEGARSWWDLIYPAHALSNGQWWIMANQCGTQGETTFLGSSRIISPLGDVVAQAPAAGPGETPEPALLVHTLELDRLLRRADEEAGALVDDLGQDLSVEVSGDPASRVPAAVAAGSSLRETGREV